MYNFSGIFFRIWGFVGIVCILFQKPWAKDFKIQNCKLELFMIAVAVCMGLVYASRILFPDISSYTGEFIATHRNSRYVFWNGEGKRQEFYLDVFSKKEIFPYEFESKQKYTIYFDEFTNVIIKVEIH